MRPAGFVLSPAASRAACWTIVASGLLAAVVVQQSIDEQRGRYVRAADALYLRSGRLLSGFCLGYGGLVADLYWTRAVQYFGRRRLEQLSHFELLGPLLRLTTELDPHLLIAYRFGSIFLAEKQPGGAGEPELALELLRRGIVANPDYWRLWEDLGFIYYWDLKDYTRAARAFEIGSQRPGASQWMKAMAASVAAKGADIETSRLLWSEIYRNGENDQIRRSALDHLMALDAREQLAGLNRLLARHRQRKGHAVRSFQELVAAGLLSSLPKDPSGFSYLVSPKGEAILSPQSRVDMRLLQ